MEATSNLLAEGNVGCQNDVNSGVDRKNLLSFNLMGELVKTSHEIRNFHQYACPLKEYAIPTVSPVNSLEMVPGDMLVESVVCEGVTVVNDAEFPHLP